MTPEEYTRRMRVFFDLPCPMRPDWNANYRRMLEEHGFQLVEFHRWSELPNLWGVTPMWAPAPVQGQADGWGTALIIPAGARWLEAAQREAGR